MIMIAMEAMSSARLHVEVNAIIMMISMNTTWDGDLNVIYFIIHYHLINGLNTEGEI